MSDKEYSRVIHKLQGAVYAYTVFAHRKIDYSLPHGENVGDVELSVDEQIVLAGKHPNKLWLGPIGDGIELLLDGEMADEMLTELGVEERLC